jgi:catalase (peroxidase I)
MQEILKPVKAKFPDLSYADIWTMAGTQAVQLTGGPDISFRYGRTDAPDNSQCPENGRLPDASQGAQHLRDVFGRMGFGVSQMEDDSNGSTDSLTYSYILGLYERL